MIARRRLHIKFASYNIINFTNSLSPQMCDFPDWLCIMSHLQRLRRSGRRDLFLTGPQSHVSTSLKSLLSWRICLYLMISAPFYYSTALYFFRHPWRNHLSASAAQISQLHRKKNKSSFIIYIYIYLTVPMCLKEKIYTYCTRTHATRGSTLFGRNHQC